MRRHKAAAEADYTEAKRQLALDPALTHAEAGLALLHDAAAGVAGGPEGLAGVMSRVNIGGGGVSGDV